MATPEEIEPLQTTVEVADYLKVPVQTLYRWANQGTGPRSFTVGRHRRYRRADVDEWLEQRRRPAATHEEER